MERLIVLVGGAAGLSVVFRAYREFKLMREFRKPETGGHPLVTGPFDVFRSELYFPQGNDHRRRGLRLWGIGFGILLGTGLLVTII